MFSRDELRRYGRHIILPEIGKKGQFNLKNARVLVIGAGGLGCPILQYLTAVGVGTIGILDFDTVDESNLQRQILYTSADVGKPKVEVAYQRLKAQNPHVDFEVHLCRLDRHNALQILDNYDVIADGSDNFATRYLVNDACVILGKPLVFGAIFKFDGQISVFNYEGGATYRCLFPEPPDPQTVPSCAEVGVLGILPAIVGCLQANEIIKIITGIGEVLKNKLLVFDALSMQFTTLTFSLNPANLMRSELMDYEEFCQTKLPQKPSETRWISAQELKTKLAQNQALELIDVREEIEHEIYHIGGKNLPLDDLENLIQHIDNQKDIVVYCQKGIRSLQAIERLKIHFPQAQFYSLKNGLQDWVD